MSKNKKEKTGWVKVYRKLMDNDLWKDKPFARGQAWVDLIMLASHNDHEFLLNSTYINLTPGEIVTSKRKLGERWGWSITKVTKFLDELENVQMLSKKSDTKKTTIKLTNYQQYQRILENDEGEKITQKNFQKEIKKKSKKNQKETYKNYKELKRIKKNDKEYDTPPAPENDSDPFGWED